jgi:hypothetical protein
MFVTDGTKTVRDEIQVGVQEMCLGDILHPIYTICITVIVHPQFQGSWGIYDFLKNFTTLNSTQIFQRGFADLRIFHFESKLLFGNTQKVRILYEVKVE